MDKIRINRFWSYVAKGCADACWPWTRCASRYGFFDVGGRNELAHRIAYELTHGEDSAKGKVVRHKCDNPLCCNPNHLELGTHKDNMNDKMKRGRGRFLKGNECSWSKLNEGQVREIRKLLKQKIRHKVIAEKYGVDTVTITDINLGRSWRHV